MQTILLCGKSELNHNPSLKKCSNNNYLIDLQISSLKKMGFGLTVVLDNFFGDEILSKSKLVHSCDLVYDTNTEESNLYSNLKSALYSVETLSFALPVFSPLPNANFWNEIVNNNFKLEYENTHIVESKYVTKNGDTLAGYPLFITKKGHSFIKESKGITNFTDSQLLKEEFVIADQIENFNPKLIASYIDTIS